MKKFYFYSGFLKPRPQRGVPFSTVPSQYFHGTLETELNTDKDFDEILTLIAYHKKGLGGHGTIIKKLHGTQKSP